MKSKRNKENRERKRKTEKDRERQRKKAKEGERKRKKEKERERRQGKNTENNYFKSSFDKKQPKNLRCTCPSQKRDQSRSIKNHAR